MILYRFKSYLDPAVYMSLVPASIMAVLLSRDTTGPWPSVLSHGIHKPRRTNIQKSGKTTQSVFLSCCVPAHKANTAKATGLLKVHML
jgi:hypothetical protein